MSGQIEKNNAALIGQIILVVSLFGTLLLPSVELLKGFPKIELSDLTFPLLIVLTAFLFRQKFIEFWSNYYKIVIAFSIFILVVIISIFINGRYMEIRDWFEMLKYLKFIAYLMMFPVYFSETLAFNILKPLFIGLFAFNLLHYFNILDFNTVIEPFYTAKHHLDFFGLNSIGLPATKRAMGTMGNPNNNGFMFLLFLIFFLPKQKKQVDKSKLLFSSLALIGIFMCQSRTVFLALLVVLLIYFVINKSNKRRILYYSILTVFTFTLFYLLGNSYIGSLGNMTSLQSAGIGRLEQWIKILHEMPEYWIFGHGPNKEFFEANNIYAESEYFLLLFRYGIVGLAAYAFYIFLISKDSIRSLFKEYSLINLVLIAYLITAITNTPMHSVKLQFILSMLLGMGILLYNDRKKKI